MGKSRLNCWWSPSELKTEIRSGTWAKRFYIWRLLGSCRAPLTRDRLELPKVVFVECLLAGRPWGVVVWCLRHAVAVTRHSLSSRPVYKNQTYFGWTRTCVCWCRHIYTYLPIPHQIGFYKIFVYFKAFVDERIIPFLPLPTCSPPTTAILLHVYCAIYDAPPTPLWYAIHHTILVMAISCKGQTPEHSDLYRAGSCKYSSKSQGL